MTDIVEFLTARLDEREARAKLAISVLGTKAFKQSWGQWDSWEIIAQQLSACCDTVPQIDRIGQFLKVDADPARVLADVKAKREILAEHAIVHRNIGWLEDGEEAGGEIPVCGRCVPKHSHYPSRAEVPEGGCRTVRALAAPFD